MKTRSPRFFTGWRCGFLGVILARSSSAATLVWQEPVSGSFSNSQRWLVANVFPEQRRVPAAGDDIQIIAAPAITVDVAGGATVADADIGETVTLNLSGTLAVTGTLDGAPLINGNGQLTAGEWKVGAPTPAITAATVDTGSFKLTGNGYGLMVLGGGKLKAGAYNGPNTFGHAPLLVDGADSSFTLTGALTELAAPGLEITVRNGAEATLGTVTRAGAFFLDAGGKLTAGAFQPRHVAVRGGSTLTTGEAKPLGFGPSNGFGIAEVTGGSTWNAGGKFSLSGSTLRVSSGGRLQAQSCDLADYARLQVGDHPLSAGGGVPVDGYLTLTGSLLKNAGTFSLLGGDLVCGSMDLRGEGALQGESGLTTSGGHMQVAGAAVFDTTGTLTGTTVSAQSAVIGSLAGRRGQLTMETCDFKVLETLVIGQAGNGSLLARAPFAGPARVPSVVLGAAATGIGSLEVTENFLADIAWDFHDSLTVGDAGEGTLTIRQATADFLSGANVTIAKQAGSRGTVRVIGNEGVWHLLSPAATDPPLVVGLAGRGTLSIEGGLVLLRDAAIGRSGEDNVCQITGPAPGAGSTAVNLSASGKVIIGDGGHGTLNMDTGARVQARTLIAGRQSTADNRVTIGAGCSLNLGESVVIGDSGKARMDVAGEVDGAARLVIARGDGSQGTANVSGSSAFLRCQGIDLSGKPQARGAFSLLAGAGAVITELLAPVPATGQADITLNGTNTRLEIRNRMRLGRTGQASGPVTCNVSGGAKLVIGNEAMLRKNARLALTGASVLVGPGEPPPDGTLLLRTGGRLSGDGTVAGRVEVAAGGRLAPGAALGTLTIEGDVIARPAGTLEFEIGGLTAPAGHDLLHATGAVNVQGAVELKFINGYAPHAGDRYCFITADGGLTFAPSAIVVSGVAPGFAWTLSGDANNFCITAGTTAQPASTPELTLTPNTSGGLSLDWSAENWQLESAEDLNGNWQPVQSPPGGEGSFSLEVTPGGGGRFWRLRK